MNNMYDILGKFRLMESRTPAKTLSEGFSPSEEVADMIEKSMGGAGRLTSDDLYRAVIEYQSMMDSPHKLDVDEVVQILMDRLHSKGIMVPDVNEEVEVDEKVEIFHRRAPGADMQRYHKDASNPAAVADRKAAADAAKKLRASGDLKAKKMGQTVPTDKGGAVAAHSTQSSGFKKGSGMVEAKPDFLDLDRDGNKTEPMKGAAKAVDEASTGDYSSKKARAGKDIGKPGKNFEKIAKSAGERYGSKERGEKVAGAVLAKLRAKESVGEGNDGNLANNAKPYDKVTRGDVIAGRLGKDAMGGKAKKHVKKESLQLVKVLEGHGRRAQVMLDTEYNEYQVRFVAEGREAGLEFTEVAADAVRWANQWVAEGVVTRTPTGLVHRGSYGTEYQGDDDEGDDTPRAKKPAGEKRAAGRPKGTGRKLGARGPSGKSKLMTREAGPADEPVEPDMDADDKRFDDMDESALQAYLGNDKMDECADDPEYGQEGDMAKDDLRSITMAAKELHNILGDDQDLPEWVQSKITKALDYINSSNQYMKRERDDMDSNMGGNEEPIAEKAVSVKQRRAAGIAHAAQKGEIPKSELRGASKEMAKMSKGELHKFAATKEKGLPDKKGKKEAKEEVEETTVAGSVATTDAGPKGKKGMQFGKGIYEARLEESYRAELARQLTESVNVNMSISSEGQKSLNVTATDDDAVALGELLKMAGLMQDSDSGSSGACPACGAQHGMHEAGCSGKMVEEGELANTPEPEYADTNTMVNTLSGGLNGRKTTGQTTIPVLQRDPARQGNPAVAEQRLWNMYKKYSG